VLPDGKLASGSWDRTVRVWDTASGACLHKLSHTSDVTSLTVLRYGSLAVGLGDGSVHMWE
jgi:WD40 repeat protein